MGEDVPNDTRHYPSASKFNVIERLNNLKSFLLRPKTLQTICYCLAFLILGLALAAPGPALLALGENTNSTVSQMGYSFSARSVGYLFGSVVGGPLFDRYNGNRLLSASLLVTAIGNFCVPLATSVWQISLMFISTGFSMGFLDTGANVSILWLFGDEAGPYMQSLHFAFGLGAFLSPIFVGASMSGQNGDPKYAFWAICFLTIPLCLWLLTFSIIRREDKGEAKEGTTKRDISVVLLTGLFLAIYVGAEVCAGLYLYSYSVFNDLENKTVSAYLTSTFWGFLSIGRLIAIPLSLYLSAEKSLVLNLVGCTFSTLIWLFFLKSRVYLWFFVIIYGLSMSSTFPTAINLAESYVSLTGKLASLFVVGASFGEMLIPVTVAYVFESVGTFTLVWTLFAAGVLGSIVCIVLIYIGRGTTKYKASNATENKYAKLVEEMIAVDAANETASLEDRPSSEK